MNIITYDVHDRLQLFDVGLACEEGLVLQACPRRGVAVVDLGQDTPHGPDIHGRG